ncbi:MAG: hypothetical protein PUF62_11875 [Bacteroidales bacterium]|nr:hypothetical protein [Bacteroidales bacterium]
MRSFGKTYAIMVTACALVSACTDKGIDDQPGARLEMRLDGGATTRAHFEDNAGVASFVWDVGGEMIAVGSHGGSIFSWTGGEFFSPMNVTLLDPSDSHKVLGASSSLSMRQDAAAAGDPLFFLSPVNGSALCTVSSSASAVSVDFKLPSTFAQSASTRLEEFEPYCFIHGESTVHAGPSGGNKNFTANTTTFRAIPATFRFNVSNNTSADVVLESVKITCNKLFPDRLVWSTDGRTMSIKEPVDKSGYFNTIKTSIASGLGEKIAAKEGESVSTGTYYAMCLPFDSDDSMSGATLAFILETSDKVHTFNLSASEFFSGSTNKRFESNRIYTFNFSLGEESVELEGVTISDWVGEPFHAPTEEVSEFIKVSPTYWVQDRKNLYTYAFAKLLDTTLWGECNLGEYLYYSTDVLLNWREITPSGPSDQDYLSRYFDGITDFKWATPRKEDFEALFNETNTNIAMTHDVDSGIFGLKISRKDKASVSIFLPCTERVDEVTTYPSDGITHIARTLQGYYWTLDEDPEDGTKALLLHFQFGQEEVLTGETSTSITYTKGLGGNLYEFVSVPKSENHVVRPILRND